VNSEKTTDLSQVTDKLYHIMLHTRQWVHALATGVAFCCQRVPVMNRNLLSVGTCFSNGCLFSTATRYQLYVHSQLFSDTARICFTNELETIKYKKTTDLSQVTDKLYHIMLHTRSWSRFEHTISVVRGNDYICSYKSNYHLITATTAPCSYWYTYIFCRYKSI
jgi:hypothetical protein